MSTLNSIFEKMNIVLYHNESLDLDHYYQEPYQDENDEIKEMGEPFETDKSKKKRAIDLDMVLRDTVTLHFLLYIVLLIQNLPVSTYISLIKIGHLLLHSRLFPEGYQSKPIDSDLL